MRRGILGGSFDPLHYGHLLLAERCRESCQLDQVWFIPAATAPHKRHQPPLAAAKRVEMLELGIAGHPAFAVGRQELERGGISYTVDTLEQLHRQSPEVRHFLLLGADSLRDLPQWRDCRRICELADIVAVRRGTDPAPNWGPLQAFLGQEADQLLRRHDVEMPRIDLSSSDIRAAVADGRSVRYQTPRAVEMYILTQQLYRSTGSS
jgi:nicotinate-nucleotide adenylyltransferase